MDLVAKRKEKRGIFEIKWKRTVIIVMRQKNLTPEDSINQSILRKATLTEVKLANYVVYIYRRDIGQIECSVCGFPSQSTIPAKQVKKVPIGDSFRLLTFEIILIFEQKFIKIHSVEL
jgi:hypothetical protein